MESSETFLISAAGFSTGGVISSETLGASVAGAGYVSAAYYCCMGAGGC